MLRFIVCDALKNQHDGDVAISASPQGRNRSCPLPWLRTRSLILREKKTEKNGKIDEQNSLTTMVGGHNHMGVFASSAW